MICVTGIKFIHVNGYDFEMLLRGYKKNLTASCIGFGMDNESIECGSEIIRGHIFYNYKGEEVCIGWSKDIQEAIGLPFSVFAECEKNTEENGRYIKHLRGILSLYEKAGFLKRLKYLFKGEII